MFSSFQASFVSWKPSNSSNFKLCRLFWCIGVPQKIEKGCPHRLEDIRKEKIHFSQDFWCPSSSCCLCWCLESWFKVCKKMTLGLKGKVVSIRWRSISLVMSSSWIFRLERARAVKYPSQAELGHFNFRAETELTIPTICMSN